jgi:hypothetical protein
LPPGKDERQLFKISDKYNDDNDDDDDDDEWGRILNIGVCNVSFIWLISPSVTHFNKPWGKTVAK